MLEIRMQKSYYEPLVRGTFFRWRQQTGRSLEGHYEWYENIPAWGSDGK